MVQRRRIEERRADCGTSTRWWLPQRLQILFFIVSLRKSENSVNKGTILGLTKVDLSSRLNSVRYLMKTSEQVTGSRVLETKSCAFEAASGVGLPYHVADSAWGLVPVLFTQQHEPLTSGHGEGQCFLWCLSAWTFLNSISYARWATNSTPPPRWQSSILEGTWFAFQLQSKHTQSILFV